MKTIVITGANAGIGRAVAWQLVEAGQRVIAVCRNEKKGLETVREIKETLGEATPIELCQGDLSTIASTRDLAERLKSSYSEIHVLINNAGVWMNKLTLNEEGLELSFMVNHLAPFILSHQLYPTLKASQPARVINVNAGLYALGKAELNELPTGANFLPFRTYMHTKLCNVLFTRAFADKIAGAGVTVNAVHPGVARTNLGNVGGGLGIAMRALKSFGKTPDDGAKPIVRLALDQAVEGVSGKFFDLEKEAPFAENAWDEEASRKLWDLSESLTGCRI